MALRPLRRGQGVDERQPLVLLVLQHRRALVLARRGDDRLGAGEERRHHHLIAEDEVVDDRVVAVELPAPGFSRRRRAHHGDEVLPFAQLVEVVVVQLGQRFVEPHDVAGLLQAAGAQRRAHQAEGRLALRRAHLQEAGAVPDVEALVHPLPPLGVVDRLQRLRPLGRGERAEECLGSRAHRRGGDAGGADGEEAALDASVGGDAAERIRQTRHLRFDRHLPQLFQRPTRRGRP